MDYINSLKQRLEDGKIASGDTSKTPLYAEAYEETFFPTEEQQKDYKKLVMLTGRIMTETIIPM